MVMKVKVKERHRGLAWQLLPALSGFLIGLAFLDERLKWAVFFGLLPLLYYLRVSQNGKKQAHFLPLWLGAFILIFLSCAFVLQIKAGFWLSWRGGFFETMKLIITFAGTLTGGLIFALILWSGYSLCRRYKFNI